jgi:outer membrane protein OmpA-like peptidoglycan-associated protein
VRLKSIGGKASFILILLLLPGVSGCVATHHWVREQMSPLREEVAGVSGHLNQIESKTGLVTTHVAEVDAHLKQTTAKAELALNNLEHLRLEQYFMLGIKEGTTFAIDSDRLSRTAQRAIDDFLQTLTSVNDAVFLVAGHTDSTGPEAYNYILGQRRAARVAAYLITHKGINPLRVTIVSYGEHVPLVDNTTPQGRHKNRRVEISVYKETITSTPGTQRLEFMQSSQK